MSNITSGHKHILNRKASVKDFLSFTNILSAILLVTSFFIYSGTLKNSYAFDDVMVLQDNYLVKKGVKAIPQLLTTPRMLGNLVSTNDAYRPASLITFAVEYQLFGLNPFVSHLINILLFSCCVPLLFMSLSKLFGPEKRSTMLLASLLFAFHPIHTEVVANIKSRDEIMCFLFAFMSLIFFLKYIDGKRSYMLLIGNVLFFLSLLSKETSFTFLAIFPVSFYIYKKDEKKQNLKTIASITTTALFFLVIRYIILRHYNADHSSEIAYLDNMLVNPPSSLSGLATKILILGMYFKLLFLPYPLICDYSYNSISFISFSDWRAITTLIIYVLLIATGIYRFTKNNKDVLAFAIIFYLITLSLFSNIPFLIGSQMAERFLFFPSVGFCLAMALAIKKTVSPAEAYGVHKWRHRRLLFIAVPLLSLYTLIDIKRNSEWANNFTLFSADVAKVPENCRMNNYMAIELNNRSDSERNNMALRDQLLLKAKKYSLKAVALSAYPQNVDALYSLANCYKKLGIYDSAEFFLRKGLSVDSNHILTLNALGVVYGITKNYSEAIVQFKKIIRIDSKNTNAYLNLAGTYIKTENYPEAIRYFNWVISVYPRNKTALTYLADAWQMQGNSDSAQKYKALAKQTNLSF